MTPLANPTTASEVGYNTAHAKSRNVIERCFGVLKSRFRCLDKSGGTLLYTPEKAYRIFVACSVLHNFSINRNIPPSAIDPAVIARHNQLQPATVPGAPMLQQAAQQPAVDVQRRLIHQF